MNTLTTLDQKFHATDRAKAADQSYGISTKAGNLFGGLASYFEKASNTPTGKKLVKFYTDGQRQAQDIHAEAQRLKELKKEEAGGSSYKASGLERVFGKEKEKTAETTPESCEYSIEVVLFLVSHLLTWFPLTATNAPTAAPTTEATPAAAPAAAPAAQGDSTYAQAATGEKA